MSRLFDTPLIDLVEYGRARSAMPTGKRFATHIVQMADTVVRRYASEGELLGVRASLRQQLRVLRWRDYVWRIPIGTRRFTDGSFDVHGSEHVVPNALIATTLHYRTALDEDSTGLRRIIFAEFVNGLEWACCASLHESRLERSQSVKLLAEESLRAFVQ